MEIKIIASGSTGNCYLVNDGRTKILLDAGVKFKEIQRALDFHTNDIDACLLTHEHGDHIRSLRELTRRGIKTLPTYLSTYPHPFHKAIGTFIVENFSAVHDVPCVGYMLDSLETEESLLYATDTAELPTSYKQFTHLLVEANYSEKILYANMAAGEINPSLGERIIETHLSIEKLTVWLESLDLTRLRQIYLLHLSDRNSNAVEFKRQIQELTGAEVYTA